MTTHAQFTTSCFLVAGKWPRKQVLVYWKAGFLDKVMGSEGKAKCKVCCTGLGDESNLQNIPYLQSPGGWGQQRSYV